MWMFRGMLVNSHRAGCVIVLYGKDGREGKIGFIKTITRMLTDAVE